MSHIEDILRITIRKSIKDRVQCIRPNKINGNFGGKSKEKLCVNLIGPYNT